MTTQVYRVYIKATPQAIWDAITKPEWTERYGYGGLSEYDLRPGGAYRAFPSEAMKQAEPRWRSRPEVDRGRRGASKRIRRASSCRPGGC